MSASVTSKKNCIKCDKGGGILICDGCQQSFCGKHVNEHRQELGVELDNIMQEHDSLQHEMEQSSQEENPLVKKIDEWEKDSIAKIQAAAKMARTTLQELLSKSKERLSKVCLDITKNLRSSREADDFSENDLIQWKEQLKELRSEITSPSAAKLILDKSAPIYTMKLTANDSSNNQSASSNEPPPQANSASSDMQERFLQTYGPVNLEKGGYLAKRVGSRVGFAHIRGRFLYSTGCYVIRFRIEQSAQPYRIFFGCMSSQGTLTDNAFQSPHAVGWFGFNQVYEHGRCTTNCQKYGYHSTTIENNDELHLILDCTKKEIRLFHERIKSMCKLSMNDNLAPFPWQYLVVLCNPGDSVRILPNL
jgi:hypothetical protein